MRSFSLLSRLSERVDSPLCAIKLEEILAFGARAFNESQHQMSAKKQTSCSLHALLSPRLTLTSPQTRALRGSLQIRLSVMLSIRPLTQLLSFLLLDLNPLPS